MAAAARMPLPSPKNCRASMAKMLPKRKSILRKIVYLK